MWSKLAQFILRYRIAILVAILGITVFFGYFVLTNIKMDNTYGTMLPKDSKPKRDYELLKSSFGSSESLLIFAVQTENIYSYDKFTAWYDLGIEIGKFPSVDSVFSEAHLYQLQFGTKLPGDTLSEKGFYFDKVVKTRPKNQAEVDSLKQIIRGNPFYEGLIYNSETNTSLMMAFISEDIMSDPKTAAVLFDVEAAAKKHEALLGQVRISGLPHIRVSVGEKLQSELGFFVFLLVAITSIILYIFFRSVKIVAICIAVVFVGVIISLGSIGAFDFRLSILMVLIPPLIIVISIPNCVFLINKYHQEIMAHGNKIKALSQVIQKIGNATLMTNLTTALGFGTFIFANSERLFEFGVIASINIMMIFVLCLTILPIILSFSKIPKTEHLKNLEKKWVVLMVTKIEYLSMYRRKYIYVGMVVIAGVAILGALQIKTTGNITGDLPQNDQITTDLRFIEENFGGSIPFDLLIDTKDSNSFFNRFEQIEDVQNYLATYGVFSKSLSATDGVKIINMAFSGNDSTKYEIPSRTKLIQKILPHLPDSTNSRINPFLDSTGKITRITMQIKDIGSYEVQAIIDSITPEVDRLLNPDYKSQDSLYQLIIAAQGAKKNELINTLFADHAAIQQDLEFIYGGEGTDLARYHDKAGFSDSLKKAIDLNRWDVMYTGTSVVASNGTQYLVSNLFSSLAIAIVLIGFIMAFLFRSWRMVLISLVPNFIPLLVTAGVMGFTGIPMKPSTLIVFSIAFGISVDDTIHFLAKFRQELKHRRHDFRACILVALRETGASMIYTSIVLFCGFLMFSFSEFGGTKALGVLISLTLCVAMFSNLIILPTLLLWMDKKMTHKALKREPLLELYNEEEDIDLDYLEIENLAKKYEEEDIKQNKVEPDDESTQSES